MMTLMNEIEGKALNQGQAELFTLMLAPFAPHLGEELWNRLGHAQSLSYEAWPNVNPAMLTDSEVELPVQINGMVRARVLVPVGLPEEELKKRALAEPQVKAHLNGGEPKKVIVIPNKMVSVVI
jgi:leucyl-tRNA synthetase